MRLFRVSELTREASTGLGPRWCAVDKALTCPRSPAVVWVGPGEKSSLPRCPNLCELQDGENQVQRETSYLVSRGPRRAPLAFAVLLIPYCSSLKTLLAASWFPGPCWAEGGERGLEAEEEILEPAL